MGVELVPPIITFGVGGGFLAADFTWGEAVENALSHDVDEHGDEATIDNFIFYDAIGQVIGVEPDDPTLRHVVTGTRATEEIRDEIRTFLRDVAPPEELDPQPELLRRADDGALTFAGLGLYLAAALRLPESPLDPHRRGYWHNLCHRVFRHR